VFEHYSEPRRELDQIFGAAGSRALLFTTGVYCEQGRDWWYLSPPSGQHVFFYSMKAVRDVAASFGYVLVTAGEFLLCIRSLSRWQGLALKTLLRPRGIRIAGIVVAALPTRGVERDHQAQAARHPPDSR
jgi:hypothetical protein